MHSVVRQHGDGMHLTQKQLQAMYKVLRTYRNQLSGMGIDYDNLTKPEMVYVEDKPKHDIIDSSWAAFTINFGKHKGKTIANVYQIDPGYVKWLAENSFMDDVKTAAQCVIEGKSIEKPEQKIVLDTEGLLIIMKTPYEFKDICKDLSQRSWDPERKCWTAPGSIIKEVDAAFEDCDARIVRTQPFMDMLGGVEKKIKLSNAVSSDSDFTMSDEFGHEKNLYPYQLVGAEFLELANGCGMICDTVGLGKSAQALSYLQNHPELRPAIIVCPASVKHQWYKYAYEWLVTNDLVEIIDGTRDQFMGDILILNYDILKKNLNELKKLNPKIIIFDEFHKIKNYKAQRTIAASELASEMPHCILLSGTPIFNRTSELWMPLTMIAPEIYNRRTFHTWHKKYCDSKETEYGWDFSGNSNTDQLAEELKHIMIRRTEEDVFDDLPEMTRTVIPISITNRHIYNKAKENHIAWIQEEQGKDAADRAARAEHLTRIEYLKQLVAEGKIKYSIQWIKDYLTSEDKLVVFTNHRNITDALMKEFGKIAVKIDGSTTTGEERLNIAERFENDPKIKIFIGNMVAAAEGINLGASKSVVFIEQGWSPKLHEQCEGRIKGLRQKGRGRKGLHSIYLVGINTIDVEIAAMLEAKRQVADTAMGDVVKMDFNFFADLVK